MAIFAFVREGSNLAMILYYVEDVGRWYLAACFSAKGTRRKA
jgi:hypothetical protein